MSAIKIRIRVLFLGGESTICMWKMQRDFFFFLWNQLTWLINAGVLYNVIMPAVFAAPTLYVHILVIVSSTKVLPPASSSSSSSFSMTAHLPIPDVAGGAQTHLGAAHIHFGSCYVLLVLGL